MRQSRANRGGSKPGAVKIRCSATKPQISEMVKVLYRPQNRCEVCVRSIRTAKAIDGKKIRRPQKASEGSTPSARTRLSTVTICEAYSGARW